MAVLFFLDEGQVDPTKQLIVSVKFREVHVDPRSTGLRFPRS
jgi:hypothetical protein